jgi:hypothetical protein
MIPCRTLGEELADVALYLLSIAEMNGIDLQAEVEQKIRKNEARVYERDDASGTMIRIAESTGSHNRAD